MLEDASSARPAQGVGAAPAIARALGATGALGQVLVYLGFSFVCTAGGAALGIIWGDGAFMPALIGAFACLIALRFFAAVAPLNMALLYTFATLEGVVLGLILQSYAAQGYGGIAIDAAASTALLTLAAGGYGLVTKRDLTSWGGILFAGLIGLLGTLVLAALLHLSAISTLASIGGALLFLAFLAYDFNRIARRTRLDEATAILVTVRIYLDILNLFLFLLRILRAFR